MENITENVDFSNLVQKRVANISIGPSTLRNQGKKDVAPTVTTIAREFLGVLKLAELRYMKVDKFDEWLNDKTKDLEDRFKDVAPGNWGAARKAINVFLENAFYDRLLSEEYNLQKLVSCLINK